MFFINETSILFSYPYMCQIQNKCYFFMFWSLNLFQTYLYFYICQKYSTTSYATPITIFKVNIEIKYFMSIDSISSAGQVSASQTDLYMIWLIEFMYIIQDIWKSNIIIYNALISHYNKILISFCHIITMYKYVYLSGSK